LTTHLKETSQPRKMASNETNEGVKLPEDPQPAAGTGTSSIDNTVAATELSSTNETVVAAEGTATANMDQAFISNAGGTTTEATEQTSTSTAGEIAVTAEQTGTTTAGETAETPKQTGTTTAGQTAVDTPTDMTVVLHATSYPILRPSIREAINVFRDVYRLLLLPAFAHPVWAQCTPDWAQSFPAHTRSIMDMFESLGPNQFDPEMLRNWFATFVKSFCENEMAILHVGSEAQPGAFFDVRKYGLWCNHYWSPYWRLAFWVQPVYAYRNEWAWGVDGGTRGLASFTEAVGLWAHCFCRMLEKGWASRTRLYRIACWEMIEYLYKWAIRVQPPPDPVPAIADTTPAQAPQPGDGEDEGEDENENEDSKSHHSDDSEATVVPLGRTSTTLDQTDLDLNEVEVNQMETGWLDLSDRDEEDYPDDEETAGQEPYSGSTELLPTYTEPFPSYTEPFPEYIEPFPEYIEPFPQYTEPFPDYESFPEYVEPASSAQDNTAPGTSASQATSRTPEVPPVVTTPVARTGRARARADAAERAEAEDAELAWFAQHVLDREL
jgi:hypothetical protein